MITTEKEISLDDIKEVTKVLKKLNNSWAKEIAARMFPDLSEEKANDSLRNIISGNKGRDQVTRASFMKHAVDYKTELESTMNEGLNNLTKITG